ncbi:hypothetical protein [Opitutus sp. ER46]|uniref:hypothetical protein n=1 Tax=Opitutus sp. ER46 TaxID=2161864 RepID=UPI0011B24AF2|nr:hypothetical protein [Opitutus sp. ER46]
MTSTNSGPDSKGVVRFGNWELEGEAYLFVVVGAVGTLLVFIMSASLAAVPRAVVSLLPIILAVGWVKFFLVGRPPHFTGDFMEKLAVGRHFNLRPQVWAQWPHPRGHRPRPPLTAGKGGPR